MKQIIYILYFSIVITNFVLTSCSNDADETPPITKSSEDKITQFLLQTNGNEIPQDISGTIDVESKKIKVVLPLGVDVTDLTPKIVVSEKASLSGPLDLTGIDISEPIEYTVTAEDGSITTYEVSIIIAKSTERSITTFVIAAEDNEIIQTDISGVIDEANKQIAIILPNIDVSALKIKVEVSEGATINLDENHVFDFTKSSLELIVTAADGITTASYSIQVTFQEEQSEITTFQFLTMNNAMLGFDIEGTIDEVHKTITVMLPDGVDVKDLVSTTVTTEGATIEKIIEGERIRYEVTSADKNTVISYFLENKVITDRLVLEAIFQANPTSDIDWPVLDANSDIANWSGIKVEDGRVVEIEKEKLTVLPKEIKYLTALKVLNLNYSFLDNLPEELRYVETLTNISLIANNLTTLPTWFTELVNLRRIDLSRNKLTTFPEVLLSLEQLNYLFIRFNRGLSELPENIGELSSLLELDLSGNTLRGLPVGIKDLVKARRLNFTQNNLTSVPKEIAEIGGLKVLDLRENRSLAIVPQEICDLSTVLGFLLFLDAGVCP